MGGSGSGLGSGFSSWFTIGMWPLNCTFPPGSARVISSWSSFAQMSLEAKQRGLADSCLMGPAWRIISFIAILSQTCPKLGLCFHSSLCSMGPPPHFHMAQCSGGHLSSTLSEWFLHCTHAAHIVYPGKSRILSVRAQKYSCTCAASHSY